MTHTSGRTVPTCYRLRVDGRLDGHWARWFAGLTVTPESDGSTSLTGVIADQAQLHGLLAKVRDLGVTLLSVQVCEPPPEVRDPTYRADVPGLATRVAVASDRVQELP